MKKLLFTAGLLALLVACSKGDENIIEFEMATSDKSISLTKDENAPRCQVHLELAYATEKNGHKAEIINNAIQQRLLDMEDLPMQAATDSFANMYTNNYMNADDFQVMLDEMDAVIAEQCEILGISKTTLWRKCKEMGIE